MKKIILSLLIIFSILFITIFTSIYLLDYNKFYQDFITSAKINIAESNPRNFKINRFPTPLITIEKIKEEGKVELENVEIKFSLFSILMFNPKISGIKIDQVKIHLANDDVNFLTHDEFITELLKKEARNISAKINKLIFIESDNDIPLVIENFVFVGSNNKITKFTGEVNAVGKLVGEFITNSDQIDFNLEVSNADYDFKLQEIYENFLLKNGKVEIITSNLSEKLGMLVPDIGNLADKLTSNEQVKINFDIVPLNQWMNLKNIVIDSPSLSGKGEIAFSKNHDDISDVKINFEKFDLNSWSKNKNANAQNNKLSLGVGTKRFDFRKNLMRTNIFIKQIQLDEDNVATDINFSTLIRDGILNIENFSGIIDQTGQFQVKGMVSQNSFRNIFQGKISLTHNDLNDLIETIWGKELRSENKIPYSLISDIKFNAIDISLQNLLIKTAETEIAGSVSTKFIGNLPRTNASLKFTKIDLDKKNFPAISQIYDYAIGLTKDSKKEDYLNKFIPLRKIKSINNYDIMFDQLILGGVIYNNVDFNLSLSAGKLKIENLALNDGKNNIETTIELIASGINPLFNIIIHKGVVEANFLSPSTFLALKKIILENFDLDKIDINMNFSLSKLYQGDFGMEKVIFKGKNNKSLFEINNFEADMLGGRMVSSGSILLNPCTFNFVYALNSANILNISKMMPRGFLDSGGLISASGMWSTNGNTLEELLYNLYTKSNIITKDTTVNNFAIDTIVRDTNTTNYNNKNFKDDMRQALLSGKTEISDLKSAVELSKGVFKFDQMVFKTKYTSGSASANFNLYDLSLDLSSIFSFYLANPAYGGSYSDHNTIKLPITAKGNLFALKKEAETESFEAGLKALKKE